MFIFTNHIQPQGEIIIKILNLLLQSRPHESQGLSRDSNWAGHSKAYCDHIVMACHEYHHSWGSGDTDLSINYLGLRCGLSKSLEIYSQIIAAQCLEFWMSIDNDPLCYLPKKLWGNLKYKDDTHGEGRIPRSVRYITGYSSRHYHQHCCDSVSLLILLNLRCATGSVSPDWSES